MSLLADAEALIQRRGTVCAVARTLPQLAADDAADLRTLLADRLRFPATAIEAALAKRNIDLKADTINRHRRGRCACQG